jgi:hypothetical protein
MNLIPLSLLIEKKKRKAARGGLRKKPPKQKPRPGGLKGKAAVDKVPAQLAHCVLAVRGGQPGHARRRRRKKYDTRAAWNICRWSLTRYGYLKPPYKIGAKLKNVRQTQKGARASMKHAMEKEAPGKYKRFGQLFRQIEPDVV